MITVTKARSITIDGDDYESLLELCTLAEQRIQARGEWVKRTLLDLMEAIRKVRAPQDEEPPAVLSGQVPKEPTPRERMRAAAYAALVGKPANHAGVLADAIVGAIEAAKVESAAIAERAAIDTLRAFCYEEKYAVALSRAIGEAIKAAQVKS